MTAGEHEAMLQMISDLAARNARLEYENAQLWKLAGFVRDVVQPEDAVQNSAYSWSPKEAEE